MNIIACRPGSYREHRHLALQYMPKAGLQYVELPPPLPDEVAGMKATLLEQGLTASSLMTKCDLGEQAATKTLVQTMDTAREMDVGVIFCSVKSGGLPGETPYQKLHDLGDEARSRDVVISMETHPDLCHNADQMLKTLKAVDHPNIRVNLDPANIHFYNRGLDEVQELRKVAEYVASVHLKDSMGGFREGNFPVLGKGIVHFPEIFGILNDLGFHGPFTLELEGVSGLTIEATHQRVVDSMEYLRSIGAAQ
jgi:sugar phosphate isomerase/epimerase